MASNLLFTSVLHLVLVLVSLSSVSVVICGRLPVGALMTIRMKGERLEGGKNNSVLGTQAESVGMGRQKGDDDVFDGDNVFYPQDSLEEEKLDEYYEFEPEENSIDYITDVQINQLKTAQEKISQDQEAYVLDPRCPKFDGICQAPNCSSDSDCSTAGKICCYNGCVHTCVSGNSKPIEIDWIPFREQKAISLLSTEASDVITIPGGCKLTHNQSGSLDLFMKYGHVTKCVCVKGDVLCYVRQRPTNATSISTNTTGSK